MKIAAAFLVRFGPGDCYRQHPDRIRALVVVVSALNELQAGETFTVPLKTPHQVAGKDGGPCRFLVVQGAGKYDFIPLKQGSDG